MMLLARMNRLLRGLLVLCSMVHLAAPARPACAAEPPRMALPRLEMVVDADTDPAMRAWIAGDRRWFASQVPGLLDAPPEPVAAGIADEGRDATAGDDGDDRTRGLLAWLRLAEQGLPGSAPSAPDGAAAAAEPVGGHRDLLSVLRDRWLARGYLVARIERLFYPPVDSADPGWMVRIDPGPLFTVREVQVTGADFAGRQALLDAWMPRPGEVFSPEHYLEAVAAVVLECAERGYPFPIWMTRSIQADPHAGEVTLAAVLIPGPQMVVGPQRTNLPAGRGEAFVIKAAGVGAGRPFRESELRRGRERLIARDLYMRVDEPLVHTTSAVDTVGIVWRVEPRRRANRLAIMLGLGRRQEGGTRLSGQVDLDLPNLAGTGRRLNAGWRDDGQSRSRFGFMFLEPLVLGTPLDVDLAVESEVYEDAYTLFKVQNRWRLPVAGTWGLEMGVGWDRTTYPEGALVGTRRLRWRAGVLRLRGDRASSGWSGSFALETARRSTQPRAQEQDSPAGTSGPEGSLGRQDGQRLLEIDLDGELWLSHELSLAGRASFRQNDADLRPVSLPELYRFGGATSLRGYREDSFLGEKAAWSGLEVRFGRVRRSRVYTFVDVGYFERTVRAPAGAAAGLSRTTGTRVGYGLGLLTLAAPGQINLAVGFPGSVDFETAMLHVSLQGVF